MIEPNLFTIQFGCLADWNTAKDGGPWLFRNQAVLIEEYDGFTNPSSIKMNSIAVWARVLKLPDNYLKEAVVKGMCRNMGEISDVQITLPAGYVGSFVRIRVRLDVEKRLVRFVSITKARKEWYQVKYEKLPTFCGNCGLIGHWYQECGTGEHAVDKLEWGDFILVDEGRSRIFGRENGGRGNGGRSNGRGRSGTPFGSGVGRGDMPRDPNETRLDKELVNSDNIRWR